MTMVLNDKISDDGCDGEGDELHGSRGTVSYLESSAIARMHRDAVEQR